MPTDPEHPHHHRAVDTRRVWRATALLVLLYLGIAYLLMPQYWRHEVARHPGLVDLPNLTRTSTGLDGDPLNIALVGSKDALLRAMPAAGWFPADPLTFESSIHIVEASLLDRPYPKAPVSRLYLFGRPEDLAFEKPVGNNPRQRHHVRLWLAPQPAQDGRPLWIGAAIFDERVGLSRDTGEVTHVTAPQIDSERDTLLADLGTAGMLQTTTWVDDFHSVRSGRNGGGDPWHTDGRLAIAVLRQNEAAAVARDPSPDRTGTVDTPPSGGGPAR